MGLLDKLKPQPRWKHADPGVRLEAVRDLDDPIELATLAETDADARVRRAAICRLTDAAVLGRVAAGDADAETRDRAADRLVALATAADDGEEALAAVRALTDPRRLSTIARGDGPEAIRVEALARTTDERALSGIARHAKHEAIAAAALERLADPDALVDVSLNGDHKDVALGALERILAASPDPALVKSIESRTQQRHVSRRARAWVQELEAAEAARRAADEERRRREAGLCEAVERVVDIADLAAARAELARLCSEWAAQAVADQAAVARFGAGVDAAEFTLTRREREAEEAAELARQRAEAIATGDALCARIESIDVGEGDNVLAQLDSYQEEWRSLASLVGEGPEAGRLSERFALAVAACRKRQEMGAMLAETRASLDALVAEAESLGSEDDLDAASARLQAVSREARGHATVLAGASRPADDQLTRIAAAAETLAQRRAAHEAAKAEAAARSQQARLAQITRLAERARRAAEAEAITLREGERLLRDIVAGLGEVTDSTPEIADAVKALRALQEKVAPRVHELREMDEWRRFANAQRQEQLIAMAEAIVASLKSEEEAGRTSDLPATARALRELHAKWQEAPDAPRQSAQKLWDRFRGATDFIRSRCEPYFAKMREERQESLQKRAAMVEEVEALATSSDWGRAAARFQELQKAWQELGPAPREAVRELSQRFRAASNAFFARRREDLTTRKKAWAENMAKKEALCQRAEALAESMDWDAASNEMKRLQAEWKTIGAVRRNKSEEIWNRFRAAADTFFQRYHNRHQIALQGKLAERETMVASLEALAAATNGDVPASLAEEVQKLRAAWNRSVPIPSAEVKVLVDRWEAALTGLIEKHGGAFKGTDLDPTAILTRMEKLIARVEGLVDASAEARPGLSPTEQLAARLRNALASNAMGGRASEDAKWRNAADVVKEAQASWLRLGPLTSDEARALENRFRAACRRVMDHVKRHGTHHHGGGAPSRRPPRQAVGAAG
jgi:hypothetical protein